ncbi:MAG: 50S ribosomal protein L11 methyltransferase [Planctomycetaceae bacterium]
MTEYSEVEIIDNTEVLTLNLVPELPVRLLRLSGPWCADDSGAMADETFPYWAFAWAAGQAMSRYLLDHPELVRGRRVVDFGAGCGLASIAAAKGEASRVVASDIDPNSVTICRINAKLNNVTIEAVVGDTTALDLTDCDVLLASDVFFHWAKNNQVLTSDSAPPEILVAMPHKRGYIPESGFPTERLEVLAEYEAKTVPTIERADIKQVAVYRVT